MYTHMERIMTFVLEARRLGKLLVVDATGHGEALLVVVIFLMRLGFSFEDAELIMQRCVGIPPSPCPSLSHFGVQVVRAVGVSVAVLFESRCS